MKRAGVLLTLIALIGALLWSVGRLFALRFESGDVYPAASTLRTDPLGTKALADSLQLVPGIEIKRNYQPLVRLKPERPVALVYIGVDYRSRWDNAELVEFERIVDLGSRAVFAFQREHFKRFRPPRAGTAPAAAPTPAPGTAPPPPTTVPTPAPAPTPAPTPVPPSMPAPPWENTDGIPFADVAARWGFTFSTAESTEPHAVHDSAQPAAAEFDETIPWHSALQFSAGTPWKVLYTCTGVPVIIERKFGKGSIVLCSDSFFLTNEGLSKDPPGRLLAALFPSPGTIMFDEEHLGVTETSNVAMLARRMRLEGVVIALLLIAALFVWKQSTSLLPPQDRKPEDHDVTGSDANAGFINLLHRSVSPGNLLDACVGAWARARGRFIRAEERAHIDAVLRSHRERSLKDTAAAYRSIAEGLKRK